jgi:hypothetical protein
VTRSKTASADVAAGSAPTVLRSAKAADDAVLRALLSDAGLPFADVATARPEFVNALETARSPGVLVWSCLAPMRCCARWSFVSLIVGEESAASWSSESSRLPGTRELQASFC